MKDSDLVKTERAAKDRTELEKYIMVVLFLIQQRWGYVIDKELAEGRLTNNQWLMIVIIEKAFEHDPSMREVADALSTTHQNVKQLATRLESRGFVKIEQDKNNRRILRLKITDACRKYWGSRITEDIRAISSLFKALEDREVKSLFEIMSKLKKNPKTYITRLKRIKLDKTHKVVISIRVGESKLYEGINRL